MQRGPTTRAVLIMDMAGFSGLMEREGVSAALAAVTHFRNVGMAAVETYAGTWVKAWADNFMATFPTVSQAKWAAQHVTALMRSSAGIGWGEVKCEPADLWGVEVNRASRLGEDIAKAGQILLTEAAQRALGQHAEEILR